VTTGDEFSKRDILFHRDTAARYDDEITQQYAVYHAAYLEPFLDQAASERMHGRALDLGCGTGVVSLALARRGFEVVGIDHSSEMLVFARQKAVDEGVAERCDFRTGDVRQVPFDDATFDCVTCQGLLHHLDELRPCLEELNRVLKPTGRFFISDPCRDETPVKRGLLAVWRAFRKRPDEAEQPESTVKTVEAPISAAQLRSELDRLRLAYRVEFSTFVPPLRRLLPDRLYLLVVRVLSLPWRHRKGDLIFVYGHKSPI
jgi:2-polyprenyl-3-methyl-5-hydroxy-6-metoxy-1,4-benzoquinol methylase